MADLQAPVGIFRVGWFDKTNQDPADNRRRQTLATSALEVQERLNRQAESVPVGFQVRAMVLDIHARGA